MDNQGKLVQYNPNVDHGDAQYDGLDKPKSTVQA